MGDKMPERLRPVNLGPAVTPATETRDPKLKTGAGRGRGHDAPRTGEPSSYDNLSPHKPHRFGRRAFLAGLVSVATAAGFVGKNLLGRSPAPDSPPVPTSNPGNLVTTPGTTQPEVSSSVAPTLPETTVTPQPTPEPTTTAEPTTTIAERVFASPEQKAQVEAIEKRILEFYQLTESQLEAYFKQNRFIDGGDESKLPLDAFTMVSSSYNLNNQDNGILTVGLNLGRITFPGGDGIVLGLYDPSFSDGKLILFVPVNFGDNQYSRYLAQTISNFSYYSDTPEVTFQSGNDKGLDYTNFTAGYNKKTGVVDRKTFLKAVDDSRGKPVAIAFLDLFPDSSEIIKSPFENFKRLEAQILGHNPTAFKDVTAELADTGLLLNSATENTDRGTIPQTWLTRTGKAIDPKVITHSIGPTGYIVGFFPNTTTAL